MSLANDPWLSEQDFLRTPAQCRVASARDDSGGITARPLTVRETFSWVPPIRPYPPPVNWSPTPLNDDR